MSCFSHRYLDIIDFVAGRKNVFICMYILHTRNSSRVYYANAVQGYAKKFHFYNVNVRHNARRGLHHTYDYRRCKANHYIFISKTYSSDVLASFEHIIITDPLMVLLYYFLSAEPWDSQIITDRVVNSRSTTVPRRRARQTPYR